MIPLLIGLILATASVWVPRDAVDPMARALIPAVALLATGIFPCMSLAVGSMKGEQRAPKQVDELYEQLHTVMRVLVASFALAALAIVSIVGLVGLVNVTSPSTIVLIGERILLGGICLILALLGGRVAAIGRAFFAILDINRKHALLIARAKTQSARDKAVDKWKLEKFAPDKTGEALPLEKA
jgi:hypothetical protein